MLRILAMFLLFSTSAFSKDLTCTESGGTSLTWDPYKQKWNSSADPETKSDFQIKFINIGRDVPKKMKPAIVGENGVSELTLVSNTPEHYIYMELTSGGTPVVWNYFPFDKNKPDKFRPTPNSDTILSTKTYVMVGPASYTTKYTCK